MVWSASYLITITVMVALECVTAQTPVTCFSCQKSSTSWDSTNTCPESFQPPGANTCQGNACLITLSEYEGDGSSLNVTCYTNELDEIIKKLSQWSFSVSSCDNWNQFSTGIKFYTFDGMCCTTQQKQKLSPNIASNETICFCDSNYCNRNLTSFQLKSAPTTAVSGEPTGTPTADPKPGGLGTGAKVGIAFGVIGIIVTCVVCTYLCYKRRKEKEKGTVGKNQPGAQETVALKETVPVGSADP